MENPVARTQCQNNVIFSSSGRRVLRMRYSQRLAGPTNPCGSTCIGVNRSVMSSSVSGSPTGFSSQSTVASYPRSASASISSYLAPNPARLIRCAIKAVSFVDMCRSSEFLYASASLPRALRGSLTIKPCNTNYLLYFQRILTHIRPNHNAPYTQDSPASFMRSAHCF